MQQPGWGQPGQPAHLPPKQPSKWTAGKVLAAIVGALIVLGIIGAVFGEDQTATAPDSAPATAAPTTTVVKPVEARDGVITPQEQGYLDELDVTLVDGKPERAISRGEDVCLELKQKKDGATVLTNARKRFGVEGDGSDVTMDEAREIIGASREYLCPSAPKLGQVFFRLPKVVNVSLVDAYDRLEQAGIDPIDGVDYRYSIEDNGPPINPTNWAVVKQSPAPGTKIKEGSKVVLTVIRTDTGF
jgi:hypothetical protein